MNLTTDPWIPAIAADGSRQTLSLADLFTRAHEIRDLSAKPHEKIALLRLLLCITQAALDGPENLAVWRKCRDSIQPKAQAYLPRWHAAFELFGDGQRFLQLPGLKAGKEESGGIPATKLDLTLASGNNASIFDNAAGLARPVQAARLALTLVAFQCFAPGGRIGIAKWNGADTAGKGSSNHAPCIPSGMLHTFLLGANLLETLHLNLTNKEEQGHHPGAGWGQPVWELPVSAASDRAAVRNATLTYLGRLVPLSRAVRLQAGSLEMTLANGLDYPLYPIYRDPAATIVERKEGPGVLGISLGRSIWRQLSAITVKRRSDGVGTDGPLALANLADASGASLWIGALATDKAKIEDVVEAAYDVPAGMFSDTGRKLYEQGVALADGWQFAMWRSIKAYAAELKLEPPPYDRGRHRFWTIVEQEVPRLLALAGSPGTAGPLELSPWGKALKDAAAEGFDFACARQSPRQIEACAKGRQHLYLLKPKDSSALAKKFRNTLKPA